MLNFLNVISYSLSLNKCFCSFISQTQQHMWVMTSPLHLWNVSQDFWSCLTRTEDETKVGTASGATANTVDFTVKTLMSQNRKKSHTCNAPNTVYHIYELQNLKIFSDALNQHFKLSAHNIQDNWNSLYLWLFLWGLKHPPYTSWICPGQQT